MQDYDMLLMPEVTLIHDEWQERLQGGLVRHRRRAHLPVHRADAVVPVCRQPDFRCADQIVG
jgi:hypothetical protein